MDELITKVAERAGINADQAKSAVAAVFEQLDDRLPGPIAQQVRSALGGGGDGDGDGGDGPDLGGLGDAAKGLFG